MGQSTSKPAANKDTATTNGATNRSTNVEGENGKEHSTPAVGHTDDASHEQPNTSIREHVRPSLSARGKRTSFYETVDASEILPYVIVGKIIVSSCQTE